MISSITKSISSLPFSNRVAVGAIIGVGVIVVCALAYMWRAKYSEKKLSLDFYKIRLNDGNGRHYFVIGAKNATSQQVDSLAKKLIAASLNIRKVNDICRQELNLPSNYNGQTIFIRKDFKNDTDNKAGTNPSFDIHQIYEEIYQVDPSLRFTQHGLAELKKVKDSLDDTCKIVDNYINDFVPELKGIDVVLQAAQRDLS